MVHSKWPQLDVRSIGPVDYTMEHHGPCPGSDRADGSLGNTGLVVGTDSGKRLLSV